MSFFFLVSHSIHLYFWFMLNLKFIIMNLFLLNKKEIFGLLFRQHQLELKGTICVKSLIFSQKYNSMFFIYFHPPPTHVNA